MFAQYQLSQVLASGGDPDALADAVCAELVRLCGAETVALWLSRPGRTTFDLADRRPTPEECPGSVRSDGRGRGLGRRGRGSLIVVSSRAVRPASSASSRPRTPSSTGPACGSSS